MYKIGFIGERESVLGFIALGLSVHEARTGEEAAEILEKLVKEGSYAVILLTERLALEIGDALARYKDLPLPAITVIPGKGDEGGFGTAALKSAVERAVGADILFKEV